MVKIIKKSPLSKHESSFAKCGKKSMKLPLNIQSTIKIIMIIMDVRSDSSPSCFYVIKNSLKFSVHGSSLMYHENHEKLVNTRS